MTLSMTFREEILNALVDDDESIIQIENWFNYSNVKFNRPDVIKLLQQLLVEERIEIRYPYADIGKHELNIDRIEDYWFGLTKAGKEEWDKIPNEE